MPLLFEPPSQLQGANHFDMTGYPFIGHHADEVASAVRAALGASGKRATMPRDKPVALQGDDLALILAWADAFERAHEAGLHGGASTHEHHGDEAAHPHAH